MNLEQFQYKLNGLLAVEKYPFSKMTKRYFTGYLTNNPSKSYKIIAYPYGSIKAEQLLANLKQIQKISHSCLWRIKEIFEKTYLMKTGEKTQSIPVIAVVFDQDNNEDDDFVNIFDFIVRKGRLSELFTRQIAFQLLKFISFMSKKGFIDSFNSNSVFFSQSTGAIKFDIYGDQRYIQLKNSTSDIQEIGSLIFTLLNGFPPFERKQKNDIRYLSLSKQQFEKYWSITPKLCSEMITLFFNNCYKDQTTLESLQESQWIQGFTPLKTEERKAQLQRIEEAQKQQRDQYVEKKILIRDNLRRAARERNLHSKTRSNGTQIEVQKFLEYLNLQQQNLHEILHNLSEEEQQKIKFQIAHFLTELNFCDKNIHIDNIQQSFNGKQNKMRFNISSISPHDFHFNCEVEIEVEIKAGLVKFKCSRIEGSFYESLWISNYLQRIFSIL